MSDNQNNLDPNNQESNFADPTLGASQPPQDDNVETESVSSDAVEIETVNIKETVPTNNVQSTSGPSNSGNYVQSNNVQYNNNNAYNGNVPSGPQKIGGFAIASLVLGIVSVVFCCFAPFSGVFSIIGLVLGIVDLNKFKGQENPGKAMSIVGIVLSSLGTLIALFAALGFAAMFSEMGSMYY